MSKTGTEKELTDQQEKFLLAYESKGCNVTVACRSIMISRQTFYYWCDNSDNFKQKVADTKEGLYDFVENHLLALIKDGNVAATIFFCKTKMRQRGYVERQEVVSTDVEPVTSITYVEQDGRSSE